MKREYSKQGSVIVLYISQLDHEFRQTAVHPAGKIGNLSLAVVDWSQTNN